MILQDFIRFRKFTICRGSANQGDLVTNPGLLLGGCSAWLYLFQGDAVLSYPGGVTQVSAGLNDLRDHFGQPLSTPSRARALPGWPSTLASVTPLCW